MNISVTFRNTEAEDWLKEYIEQKLSKLERYIDKPVEAQVTLSVEKFRNVAEVKLFAKGMNINGREEAKEMTLAVDTVTDKIERQIKKYKEKTRNHKDNSGRSKRETLEGSAVVSPEEAEGGEEAPQMVKVKKAILQPMSVDDAIIELEETNNEFFVYRDISTEAVAIIYRRGNGGYGVIETS